MGAAEADPSISAVFDEFVAAFATFDGRAVGRLFTTPGVALRGDGTLRGFARQTEVEVGADEGGYVEITSGIPAGTQVVADGLTRVQPDATIRVVGAHGGGGGGGGGQQHGVQRAAAPQDGLRATQP